jgi:hypothetical protein
MHPNAPKTAAECRKTCQWSYCREVGVCYMELSGSLPKTTVPETEIDRYIATASPEQVAADLKAANLQT